MSDINTDAVLGVLAEIKRNPKIHYQGYWASRQQGCGTTYCIAGLAALQAGWEITWYDETRSSYCEKPAETGDRKNLQTINDAGGAALGLNAEERDRVFYGTNSLITIYTTLAELMGIEISVLEDKVNDRVADGETQV